MRQRIASIFLCLVVALFVLIAFATPAQALYTLEIDCYVYDKVTGNYINGATLTLRDANTGPPPTVINVQYTGGMFGNGHAKFTVNNPPAGKQYFVDVSMDNYIADNYRVLVTCTGSDQSVYPVYAMNPPPAIDFSGAPTSGNAPLTVGFYDGSSGTPVSWSWNFGDGGTSTTRNPSHQYTTPGTYAVSLTTYFSTGQNNYVQKAGYITVGAQNIDFTANPTSGNAPLSVSFYDQSSGSPVSWSWNFGDGQTSTSQNPIHQYAAAGTYTVSLTSTYSGGYQGSKTKNSYISVGTAPTSTDFYCSPTAGNAPLTVWFTDQSIGTPTSWEWNFGDGTANDTTQSPSHTYTNTGTYTVTLTSSGAGWTHTKEKTNAISVTGSNTTGGNTGGTTVIGTTRFIFESGRIKFYPGTTVTVYQPNATGAMVGYPTVTGSDGSVSFSLTYGQQYYMTANNPGNFLVNFNVIPNEQNYYVDIQGNTVCDVVGESQINIAYPLHTVGISFTQWLFWSVGKDATVCLNVSGIPIDTRITDDGGHVNFQVASNLVYTIQVSRASDGLYKIFTRTLDNPGYTLDVTGSFDKKRIYQNATNTTVAGTTGNPDEDIITVPGAVKENGVGLLTLNYTDSSLSTTQATVYVYTRNLTDPVNMTLLEQQTYYSDSEFNYSYEIAQDPSGMDYLIQVLATYQDANRQIGTVDREFKISFHGPLRVIPGLPVSWYKYLAWAALVVIGLVAGKFGIEEAAVVVSAFASAFYAIGWFYEFPDTYILLALSVAWTASIGLVFMKREREGRA